MSTIDLRAMSDQQLVERFREHALGQESALWDSNTAKFNRLFDRMLAVESELRRRGPEARKAVLVLLDDPSPWVRYKAAHECLAIARERAMMVLHEIVASHLMPVAAHAGMTLENLKSGQFKPV